MTATMILHKVRRIGWKTSIVLGLFLLLYFVVSLGLFLNGIEGWVVIIYLVCDLILWVVALLYCVSDAEVIPFELGLILILSLLGPVGLIVVVIVES